MGSLVSASSRIILIDGHPNDRDYYAHRLEDSFADCVVLQATTGRAGISLCEEHQPDCVVLELELPDISGFEVLLKLVPRVYRPEIAVVVLTANYNLDLLKAAVTNGAQAALFKGMASGDILEKAVLKAMAKVQRERCRNWPEHSLRAKRGAPQSERLGTMG
jgi:DNA-binding NarL/FixJ family response regulator